MRKINSHSYNYVELLCVVVDGCIHGDISPKAIRMKNTINRTHANQNFAVSK